MKTILKFIPEEPETPMINDFSKEGGNDCYTCAECSSPVEILSINDKDCSLTYKCLNPKEKENHKIQTIPISEYIHSIKKFTYMSSECYLCKKLQEESKNIPVFSYCIKCDKTICNECIE